MAHPHLIKSSTFQISTSTSTTTTTTKTSQHTANGPLTMSIIHSDNIINSLIDQQSSTTASADNNTQEDTLNHYNPLHQYDQNIYDLLLQKENNQDIDKLEALSNDNLHLFNYKFNQSTTLNSNNTTTSSQIYTINPKQLNPKINSSTSSITSSNDHALLFDDSNSISSESDPLSSSTHSSTSSTPSTNFKQNNWSMNDEFKDAIATWISQNNNNNNNSSKNKTSKSNSISSTIPKFQKTSLTKRRKSDSLVSSTSFLSLDPQPTSSSHPHPHHPQQQPTPSSSSSTITPPIEESEEEEKPFKCESCPKAFRRSEHLKRHIRSVHSNVRPFPCKFCEKKFSRSDNLAQHLRTHNKH